MTKTVLHNAIAGAFLAAHMKSLRVRAFDPGKATPGWKMNADGTAIEVKDGNPVWINADGTEGTLSGDAITRLNADVKTWRERTQTAEGNLKAFEGINADAARKALDITAKLDSKKLLDAGEVDRVKADIEKQFTGQISELTTKNSQLQEDYNTLRIDNVFNQSEFVREHVALPIDMFQAYFRKNLKISEDGKTIEAFDPTGNRIMSKKNVGQVADPGEALEILVNQHPQKAVILKANNNSGGGNNGNGGGRAGVRTIPRKEFEAMPAHQQAQLAGEMGKGTVTIVG